MLETLGSFTIGFFAGVSILYYILTKINERRSKAAAAINKVAKQIENEQNEQNEQKLQVIINVVDGGPSALLPLHGQKAKVVHANVMLHCQIEGINEVIAIPASCVVPDKTNTNP